MRQNGGDPQFLLADALGSTMGVTDASGDVVGSQLYYPYGRSWDASGTMTTDKLFTGHQQESDDLYYMKARFYAPGVGRFMQADSIVPDPMNPQALNRYSYVYGNPMRYTDPTGHGPYAGLLATFASMPAPLQQLIGPLWFTLAYADYLWDRAWAVSTLPPPRVTPRPPWALRPGHDFPVPTLMPEDAPWAINYNEGTILATRCHLGLIEEGCPEPEGTNYRACGKSTLQVAVGVVESIPFGAAVFKAARVGRGAGLIYRTVTAAATFSLTIEQLGLTVEEVVLAGPINVVEGGQGMGSHC